MTMPLYTATFTFAPGDYDDTFHSLDQAIAAAARALPGYLGEETWENPAIGQLSNVYYWDCLESLQALVRHPQHLAAKRDQARWLKGYHVVVAQVLHSHGDGRIAHPLGSRPVGQD